MGSKRRPVFSHDLSIPLFLGTMIWLLIVLYWHFVGFSIYREDVQGYIDWSYHLGQHTDYASHMPAYPFLLWAGRLLTFHTLSDTFLAQCLGYLSWVCGLILARGILGRVAPEAVKVGLLCFALFPFLGVWSAANPVADLVAYVAVLAAFALALENRFALFACAAGLGLLTHQAFYPCFAALALVCLFRGMPWRLLLASAVPFILYYAAVAVQKHDLNWILSYHLVTHRPPPGAFPIFDGLAGTLLRGGLKNAFKASLLFASFAASIVLSIYCARRKNWAMVALCAPALLGGVFATQHVAWVIFRLAKLLLFPACWALEKRPGVFRMTGRPLVYAAIALLLTLSQFFWAQYSILYANTPVH